MENIVLITGASEGIGKALAHTYAKQGYSLILIARNTAKLTQLQQTLQSQYQAHAQIFSLDLAKPESVDVIMGAFKSELKNIEILVNCAGLGYANKLTDMKIEEVSAMLEVNMAALTKLTYRILPYMVEKKRGKILNVASTAAFAPGPYMSIYYASKAYVLSFSQGIREEYRKDGITVSALCPGPTTTEFQKRAGMEHSIIGTGKLMPMMSAERVARIAYRGVKWGRRVIVPGFMNKLSVFLMWLTPNFITVKITGFLDKPKL